MELSQKEVDAMPAAPKLQPVAPKPAHPAPSPPKRHLELVPPPPAPALTPDEARRVREARWITVLVAAATAALFGLWTAALLGATRSVWWPAVFGVVLAGVVALGIEVVRKIR